MSSRIASSTARQAENDYYNREERRIGASKVVLRTLEVGCFNAQAVQAWTGMVADESRDPTASFRQSKSVACRRTSTRVPAPCARIGNDVWRGQGDDPGEEGHVGRVATAIIESSISLGMVLILEHWRRCVGVA